MAAASRPAWTTELQSSRRWKNREISPERNMVWTEPHNKKNKSPNVRVPVIYYLTRNGQLEHPHYMEVHLSSPPGLYLTDVINRLNVLRGNGLAFMYSWSCKRSYKNGYVWHDLTETDFIYPAHGQEYILKGSEIFEGEFEVKSHETELSRSFRKPPPVSRKDDEDDDSPPIAGVSRRNQSWSSFDYRECKAIYTDESTTGIPAVDASTQTDNKRRFRRTIREIEEDDNIKEALRNHNNTEIILRDEISEISPPPSDSSPETLETLMKADRRMILHSSSGTLNEDPTVNINHQLRGKASTVLMQLFSCASIGFKDCGPTTTNHAICVCPHQKEKSKQPRRGAKNHVRKGAEYDRVGNLITEFDGRLKAVEDKAYFSGSLIETKKQEFSALKRSSSYNADREINRRIQMELTEKEEEEDKEIVGDNKHDEGFIGSSRNSMN